MTTPAEIEIECQWCGDVIKGEPVVDAEQEFWLGRDKAAKFCSAEHHEAAAEAQDEAKIARHYGGAA